MIGAGHVVQQQRMPDGASGSDYENDFSNDNDNDGDGGGGSSNSNGVTARMGSTDLRRRLLRSLLDSQAAPVSTAAGREYLRRHALLLRTVAAASNSNSHRPESTLSNRSLPQQQASSQASSQVSSQTDTSHIASGTSVTTNPWFTLSDEPLDHEITHVSEQQISTASSSRAPDPTPSPQPEHPKHSMFPFKLSTMLQIFGWLLVFRINNSLVVRTYFDPDEFWQSLEVLAPRIFQGVLAAISDFFTFLLAYRLFGVNTALWTLASVAMSWFNYYCLVRTYSNSLEACITSIALYFWPWSSAASSEGRLRRRGLRISLFFAALACVVRPTSAIVWIYLGMSLLLRRYIRAYAVIQDVAITMVFAILFSVLIDYQFYHTWTFIPYDFLKVNVVENISLFYGRHPFHWYFTQGLPVVLLTLLPATIWGVLHTRCASERECFWMCAWTVCCLSLQGHKEFRFLLPIISPLLVYAGHGIRVIEANDLISEFDTAPVLAPALAPTPTPASTANTNPPQALGRHRPSRHRKWLWPILVLIGSTHFLAAIYLSRTHQKGVIQVMDWLRTEVRENRALDILFLMPCHSTPFYSYIHRNIPMRFVTCEPPLGISDPKGYLDETDILYNNPLHFFQTYFEDQIGNKTLDWAVDKPNNDFTHVLDPQTRPNLNSLPWTRPLPSTIPTLSSSRGPGDALYIDVPGQPYQILQYHWADYIVMFDNPKLGATLSYILQDSEYKTCARFFNSHFHDDSKRNGDVVVMCRQRKQSPT
ncbi:hypothetical protein BASA61_006190 [Batrachochytrium salamandrivorans]|nr:hypothetical protein BASA61_006190 [Batrachochytrium salamandrivorans]